MSGDTDSRHDGRRDRLAAALVDNRRVVVAIVLVALLAVSSGVVLLEESSGVEAFELGTEQEAALDRVEANFSAGEGSDEVAQVVLRDENVFEKEALVETLELQREIRTNATIAPTLGEKQKTVGVANLIARAAIRHERPGLTDPTIQQQITALELMGQSRIDAILRRLLSAEAGTSPAFSFVPDSYEPGTTTASSTVIAVFQDTDEEFAPTAAPPEIVDSQLAIQKLAEEIGTETAVVGSGVLTDEQQRARGDTLSIVAPVALVLVVLVLALAYRDLLDVVLGLTGIVFVQLWTFGTLGWLGIPFNAILVAVPILLIGLSIDYCIHVFMRYREARAGSSTADPGVAPSMRAGLAGVGAALVWVTVTTAIGFLSNLTSPVAPIRKLGLIAAVGIVGSFVVFVLFLPLVKVELDGALERVGFDRNKPPIGTGESRVGRLLSLGARAARRAPIAVVVATLLVTALTTAAAANVSTSWGPEDNMVDGAPEWTDHLPGDLEPGEYTAREDLRFVNEQYVREGAEVELLVEGDVTDPATLQRIDRARETAAAQEVVAVLANGEPRSLDPLSTVRQVAAEDEAFAETVRAADTTGDGVPDTDLRAVYDALFAAAPDRAGEVLHRDDGEYIASRMAVSVNPEADGDAIGDQLETVAGGLESDGVAVTVTGEPIVGQLIQDHLLWTLLVSLAVTLAAVLAVLLVVFRVVHGSATLGVVTVLPVVLTVSWIVGTMYLLGYPLSVLNAVIASLTIGIGIDYSIHVSERFREELADGTQVGEAISTTIRGTGGALLGSAATTAVGFGVLALAIHPPLQQFGTITAIMIGYAFLGAVVVLPSLLVLWARFRPVRRTLVARLRAFPT